MPLIPIFLIFLKLLGSSLPVLNIILWLLPIQQSMISFYLPDFPLPFLWVLFFLSHLTYNMPYFYLCPPSFPLDLTSINKYIKCSYSFCWSFLGISSLDGVYPLINSKTHGYSIISVSSPMLKNGISNCHHNWRKTWLDGKSLACTLFRWISWNC